jgi:hypothetical protein
MKKSVRLVPAVALLLFGTAWCAEVHHLPPTLGEAPTTFAGDLAAAALVPSQALLDSEMVYYDDGVPAWFYTMEVGQQVAVKFTPAQVDSGGECLSVLMMLYDAAGPGDIELHVWEDDAGLPGDELMSPLVVHPTHYVNGGYPWNTFYNVRFQDSPDTAYTMTSFWVGARWLALGPNPLADATLDYDRSYVYQDGSWDQAVGDLMIRLWYGQDVAVELTEFLAEVLSEGVVLRWHTETETDNFGFNILRSTSLEGRRVRLNDLVIPGQGTTAIPHDYTFFDESVNSGSVYYYYLEDLDYSGHRGLNGPVAVSVPSTNVLPEVSTLVWGWPNPFREQVEILVRHNVRARDFAGRISAPVNVTIYDARGRLTKTLVQESLPQGLHCATWDGTDQQGVTVPSGVYFCRLQTGEYAAGARLVLVR